MLVVYSLVADASLFEARFAHSPALWRDDDVMVAQVRDFLASNKEVDTFLYMSMGSQENEKMTSAYESAAAALRHHAPEGLRWRADLTEGANHRNNALLSTPIGFQELYASWRPHAVSSPGGGTDDAVQPGQEN